jgi:hypothetical protein
MAAVGGSIESVSVDGRLFAVATDASASRNLGGFKNEVAANGNGTARLLKTRVPWMLEGLTLEVDDDRSDHEFLKKVSDSSDFVDITITFASGHTYQGSGTIVDDVNYDSSKATAEVKFSGPGEASQQ